MAARKADVEQSFAMLQLLPECLDIYPSSNATEYVVDRNIDRFEACENTDG